MSLKVLIIPDKFKGTLTAEAAAQAMAAGWRKARPEDVLELLPMSDGGDGFGAVTGRLLKATVRSVGTLNAAHQRCSARWWWEAEGHTAVIESATIIGLAMLPPGRFHPFKLDTFGLGRVIQVAAEAGARRCWIGIGGSATNDGGFGLARSLGWEFAERNGAVIESWTGLDKLVRVRPPQQNRLFRELVVAVDVQNPLLGPRGATRVYGPQKGLRPGDFPQAERCLSRLARVMEEHVGAELSKIPGTGAAGGLGFGLAAFLGARLKPGFELFARQAKLEQLLRGVDLVVTGEGSLDRSSLMGKGVGQIAALAVHRQIPCIGLAGEAKLTGPDTSRFFRAYGLTELTTVENAKAKPAYWLERLSQQAAAELDETIRKDSQVKNGRYPKGPKGGD